VKAGDEFTAVVAEDVDRTRFVMYAAASGDFHPVHHDDTVAVRMGYPHVFAHGMLTMGVTGRFLEEIVGRGTLLSYSARLVAQVWPGDTLTATLTVDDVQNDVATLTVRTVNQHGVDVLSGHASARTISGAG
jgi:acyl dehydratase